MTDSETETVVALVLLQPAPGTAGRLPAGASVRVGEPDPATSAQVQRELAAAGFAVGPVVGISMSITGPQGRFEEFFGVTVEKLDDGSWTGVDDTGERHRELPLADVPGSAGHLVQAVTFEPPAEAVDEVTP